MGVDWFTCNNCGENFPDCGDYESCECGENWCSLECAKVDGYEERSCKLGYSIEDNECDKDCYDCDNFMETSCKYCRKEDFEDSVLLDYSLQLLGLDREELIEKYKISNGK